MKNNTIRDLSGYEVGKASNDGLIEKPITYIQTHINAPFRANPNELIFVKSNYVQESDGGDRVAFSEKHEAHPNSEAFISGAKPQLVALTENVALALSDGEILPASPDEVNSYEVERTDRARRALQAKRQDYREKFVAVFGSAEGFDEAFKAIEKREGLAAAIEVLR
jgi:hypothetical protein